MSPPLPAHERRPERGSNGDPAAILAPRRSTTWIVAAILLGAITVLYARGLGGAFVCDDRTAFTENDVIPRLRLVDAWQVFVRPTNYWGDRQPVRDLLWVAEANLFGTRTLGYHAVSIAMYAVLCALSFALVRALHAARPARTSLLGLHGAEASALFAVALFAAHPVHVEDVAYVFGQKELLYSSFSVAALLLFHRAFGVERRRMLVLAGAVALYYLALLSKQTAIVLALLVPLLWAAADAGRRPRPGRSLVVWATVNAPALLWIVLSRRATEELFGFNSLAGYKPLLLRIPVALKVLGAHTLLALKPFPLSFGYPFDDSPSIDANLVAGALTLAILVALAVRFRRDAIVVLGAATFLSFLLPVMQLHGTMNNASVYDRYLVMSVLGLTMLLERAASALPPWPGGPRAAYAAVFGAFALSWSAMSLSYVPRWADDVAVTRNTYRHFPRWNRAPFELACALIEAGRLDEAAALVAREESFSTPVWVRGHLEGWIALERGEIGRAISLLAPATGAALAGGYYPFPGIPLGKALVRAGRSDEARQVLVEVLSSPLYQPLEAYHARKILDSAERRP